MNLASRCRSFLARVFTKRNLIVLALLVGLGGMTYVSPVLAQSGTAAPAPAPASGGAAASAPAASGGGVTVPTQQGLASSIWNGASSVDCTWDGGAGDCLLQVVGFVVTFIFSIISYFLSKLLLVLTGVLITFAKYNKFNVAPPVTIGWVIVRDIANMFFIVILLASAFLTIVGLAERFHFHYKTVIPGILTAAVLVNFSRTIVLLMIDFSQVVTLTFVSAFEGSIAGNLIQGLGITQMVRLQDSNNAGGAGTAQVAVNLVNICLAYLLSIFLLLTAVATVLIYVGYFIFRIVALWMLIIFSPAAFLASSLPAAKGFMGGQVGKFWGQLTTLLTGGPMIAFCLWLTFATIQNTASSGGLAGTDIGFDFPADSTLGFITQIGTAPQLAGFIVGVAMMIMGFTAATSASGELGKMGLPDLSKTIAGYRDKAFKTLSRAPVALPAGAVRAGAGAVRAGFNALDKRNNWSGNLGAGIARGRAGLGADATRLGRVGAVLGDAARFVPGMGGVLATGAAGALTARRAGMLSGDRKKIDEQMGKLDNLPPEERVAALRNMRGERGVDDFVMGPELLQKQHDELMKDDNRKTALKQHEKEVEAELKQEEMEKKAKAYRASNPAASSEDVRQASQLTKDELGGVGRRASAIATKRLAEEENARIDKLREYATKAKDSVKLDQLKKETEKRMRYDKQEEYDERIGELAENPALIKDVDASVRKSGQFAVALMKADGVFDKDGKVDKLRYEDMKEKYKDNKDLVETLDQVKKGLDGGITMEAIKAAIVQKDKYDAPRLHSTADGNGLYSQKENSALEGLRSGGATGIKSALDAKLPIEQIKEIVDATGVGNTVKELQRLASSGASLKDIDMLVKAANDAGAKTDEVAALLKGAIPDADAAGRLMSNYHQMDMKEREQVANLVTMATKVKGAGSSELDTQINAFKKLFPDEGRIVEEPVMVRMQVPVPALDASGRTVMEERLVEGELKLIPKTTLEWKMVPDPTGKTNTKKIDTPAVLRNALYRGKDGDK